MKIRALICVWLAGMLGLAMCGSGLPDIGLSSGQGRYAAGLRTGLHNNGGGAVGWDTVTIVLTTQDVLTTDSNPASIDTSLVLGIPGSEFGSTAVTLDYAWRLRFTAALAAADSAYRLGTGFDVPGFAWTVIDRADTNGYSNTTRAPLVGPARYAVSPLGSTVYVLDSRFPTGTEASAGARAATLLYVPWESRLPRNCTIVSATVNVSNYGNSQYTELDTIVSVLMTGANDNQWYRNKGITNCPDYAKACWNRQETTNGGTWTATNRYVWNPALNDRAYYWNMGSVSDWSGSVVPNASGFTPIGTGWAVDITDCVQASVNGTTNNGIAIMGFGGNTSENDWGFRGFDDYGEAIGRTPYIVIKYITKRYQKPFGSSDWALVVSTDDARYNANAAYTAVFGVYGGKYTIYMAKNQIGDAFGPSTPTQLLGFWQAGMEVGNHSRYHKTTHGLTHWHSLSMTDTSTAAYDSLMFDAGPVWMYNMADTIVGDLRADPNFAKSLALPESQLSPEVQTALYKCGYEAVRYKAMNPIVTGWRHYSIQNTKRAAAGDSASAGFPSMHGRAPRNMVLLPTTMPVQYVFARRANTSSTQAELDSLKHNIRRLVYQTRGQDRGVISLFWHDLKTGWSVDYGGEGVDANELAAVLEEVNALGGRYMTASEYARWIKAGATAVDSPNRAAIPDTFESTAAQRVWFKPNGVDNRWIRGVK